MLYTVIIWINLGKFDNSGNFTNHYTLNRGKHEIMLIYLRSNSTNNNNSIEIRNIYLKGSNKGGAVKCIPCPEVNNLK